MFFEGLRLRHLTLQGPCGADRPVNRFQRLVGRLGFVDIRRRRGGFREFRRLSDINFVVEREMTGRLGRSLLTSADQFVGSRAPAD